MSTGNQGFGFGNQFSAGVDYGAGDGQQEGIGAGHAPAARPPQPGGLLDLGSSQSAEPVKDISTAQFMAEVIEESRTRPVIVDFWAPWCGPCRQLGPAIESAVAKAGGKVKLVKMNIDDHPEVAGQMGIQSIPAVVAFVDGQPRDAFMGAKPESEITKFIEKLVGPSGPSPLERALAQAAELENQGNTDGAAQVYGAILQQQPDNADALAGYGHLLLKAGNLEQARAIFAMAAAHRGHAGIDALAAAIELAEQASHVGDFADLEAKLADNPGDHQARYDLAIALNGAGRREEAADHLLHIISKDRQWNDDGAKAQLLKFFESWGPMDSATLAARRRLSSLLFS